MLHLKKNKNSNALFWKFIQNSKFSLFLIKNIKYVPIASLPDTQNLAYIIFYSCLRYVANNNNYLIVK